MENKTYTYKDNSYNWVKTNFEYRSWSKKFLREYNLFERDFLKESKTDFYKEVLNILPTENISQSELESKIKKNIKPESLPILIDFNTDIQTCKEIFLCDTHNIMKLLENCLEGFKTPVEIDEDLEKLALEVLEDFFLNMNKQTNFLNQ